MDQFEIFMTATPGLEAALLAEALENGFSDAVVTQGGVTITGGWPDVWRANLTMRGATRILARVGSFMAFHLAQLDKRARKFPWGKLLDPKLPVRVEVSTSRKSKIYHAGAATQRIETALRESHGMTISPDAAIVINTARGGIVDEAAFAANMVYPPGARDRGARGVVTVRALVDTAGEVISMEIIGTADAELAQAALDAVAKTPFTPGSESGRLKEMWTMIPVNFTTSNGEDRSGLGLADEATAPGSPIEKPSYDIDELYGNFNYSGGLSGETTVTMRVLITETGEVSQVMTSNKENQKIAEAAAEAVRKTTFSPGTQNGEPIPVWVTVDMTIRPR